MRLTRKLTVGALCVLLALPACQMAGRAPSPAPAASKAKAGESLPPTVAARATTASGKPAVVLNTVAGRPGVVVTVTATLAAAGASIAGTQNDIGFDPAQIAIAPNSSGKPDCAADPRLRKEGTAFSFLPPGCNAATGGCTSVRALVLSLSNVAPIPNGSALYTCKVRIAPTASPGAHTLSLRRVGFSSPSGQGIPGGGVEGTVTVSK